MRRTISFCYGSIRLDDALILSFTESSAPLSRALLYALRASAVVAMSIDAPINVMMIPFIKVVLMSLAPLPWKGEGKNWASAEALPSSGCAALEGRASALP
jgi:hypothetical protein